MCKLSRFIFAAAACAVFVSPQIAAAQANPPVSAAPPAAFKTGCGRPMAPPLGVPPDNSAPVLLTIELCFPTQGDISSVEPNTYLYYIHTKDFLSTPSKNVWQPYTDATHDSLVADHKRLWATNFLDDLSIESTDYVFPNGVVGKVVSYRMEERERIKLIDYSGSKKVERTKIDEKLRELNVSIPADSFRDDAKIRRAESVIRSFMADKGFANAEVTHTFTPVPGGNSKLISLTFDVQEGPKLKIRKVDFIGNTTFGDGTLTKRLKTNRPKPWFNPFSQKGTWRVDRYEEDVELVGQHYRNNGFLQARVGAAEFTTLETSKDGKTRYVEMRVPVTEGKRYRVGEFALDGNTVLKTQPLIDSFSIKKGEFANEEQIRKGLQRAQEAYGTYGYMEFTGYPDYRYRDEAPGQVPPALALVPAPVDPIVDVTMRLNEGKQFFINKITFVGNTTTRDNVIRREMSVLEGGVLNMELLKYSVRRINQLGYFKQLEEQKVPEWVQKTEGKDNAVDLTVKVEEQNRNQITFGAGVSQFEGFFGQLSFQTSNFLGRGESLTVSMQAGSRAQQYQLGFTEPFLFDRNMTGGIDVYRRTVQYISQFTQVATGGNLTFGVPVAAFSRMFFQYSYEQVRVQDLNEAFFDSSCLFQERGCSEVSLDNLSSSQLLLVQRNPFLYDSLLIGQSGERIVSKITPSFVHNTVDNPIFPNRGKRYTFSLDMAGLGGNTKYMKPRVEGIWFLQHTRKTSLGVRGRIEYIKPVGSTTLPIFERLYLGGEYDIRGYDIRTIGPTDPLNRGLVLGGNKSLLFNAEYLISIAGPVRLILFYDAGQVRDIGQRFAWKEDLTTVTFPDAPILTDPFSAVSLVDPNASRGVPTVIGRTSAFKTSTGAEIRFFMPVLNVPFRLIFAANPQRGGVLDNSLRPAKDFTFKFAVGSTF